MARRFFRRLTCETLENRALMAVLHNADLPSDVTGDGQVTADDASAVLAALNGVSATGFHDVSGDGQLSPLDALLAIQSLAADSDLPAPAGENIDLKAVYAAPYDLNSVWKSNIAYADAPADPAELDKYLSGDYLSPPQATSDGKSPFAHWRRYYAAKQSGEFKVRIFDLGDDNDGYIEQGGRIEFLNLPAGWTTDYSNGTVSIRWPGESQTQTDLRFRLIDNEGRSSNIGVVRLVHYDAAKPNQSPLNPFDITQNGRVDYFDLLIAKRNLEPRDPPLVLGGVSCSKRCTSAYSEPKYYYGPFADANGDTLMNQADLDAIMSELGRIGAQNISPKAGSLGPEYATISAGESGLVENAVFGYDPDGDNRSFTLEVIDDGPLIVTEEPHDPKSYLGNRFRISAENVPVGDYEVRYRLRDEFGAESPELSITVHVKEEPKPFHNAAFPEDTNNDGMLTPLDALQVIMCLNRGSQATDNITFYDVNGDRQLTPIDALLVIQKLNARTTGQ